MSLSQGGVCLSCPGPVDLGVLLPHLAGVIVEEVTAAAGLLLVAARARAARQRARSAVRCRTGSTAVIARTLADAAIGGPAGGDRAGGAAVLLRGPRLPAQDVRRAGRRPDQPLRAQDAAAGRRCSGASRSRWPGGRDRGWPPAWASPRPGRSCCGWSWPPRTRRRRPRGSSGSTTSRSGAASTTARCSSTSRPAPRSTSSKAATPGRWRTGWPPTPASR